MEKFRRLKDMLEGELDHIEERGELNASSLAQADSIAHTLKCLATYTAMEESGGYSEHYPVYRGGSYDEGSSYARGRGKYAKRDSMGRYSSEDGRVYDDGMDNRRY